MKRNRILFCSVCCLLLVLAVGGLSAGASEPEALRSLEADITGDGVPELLELYGPSAGPYTVRAFLVTPSGNIELNLTPDLSSRCLLLFADSVREEDKHLAADLYSAALQEDGGTAAETPSEEKAPEKAGAALPPAEPGTRFAFGRCEQNTFAADGPEPILWRVLDTDDETGNVLVMSEYGLITMKYNRKNVRTDWADADVRTWLNYTFLAGFTEEEQELIVRTEVSGSEDKVFLLDAAEIRRYLREPYICYATLWAKEHEEKGAYVNQDTGGSSWLVRMDSTDRLINVVGGAGQLHVPAEGSRLKNIMTTADNVVRPAMWVKREAIGEEAGLYDFSRYARAKMDISTRSGPTTGYNGLGDYRVNGHWVRVLSRVNDGSIWWRQIEFEYNQELVRCYTGLKRVDIPIDRVPDESGPLGTATVIAESEAYYGPGIIYKKQPERFLPPVGTVGTVYARENGWVFLEYQAPEYLVRLWLPEAAVSAE